LSTTADVLRSAVEKLRAAGIESARREARLLLVHALGISPDALVGRDVEIAPAHFDDFVARRAAREPLAYIVGAKEFWSLAFEVGPGVLIPRPETETLIEQVIRFFPDRSAALDVLDLGTGTGCLLIAALHEYPNAHGVGVDTSRAALAIAARNVEKHALGARCRLAEDDWGGGLPGRYDVILSNPPYIRSSDIAALAPEVRLYEPIQALDGGPDGLAAYRVLAPRISRLLKPGGLAFLELGVGQDRDVERILTEAGFEIAEMAPDLAGIGRCVVARTGNRTK